MKKQKWLSLLLAMTMLFTCVPAGIIADEVELPIEEAPAEEIIVVEEPAEAPAVEEPAEEPAPAVDEVIEIVEEIAEEAAPVEAPVEEVADEAIEIVEEIVVEQAEEAAPEEVIEVPAAEATVEEAIEEQAAEIPVEEVIEAPAAEATVEETIEEQAAELPVEEVTEVPTVEATVEEAVEEQAAELPVEEVIEAPTAEAVVEEVVEEVIEEPVVEDVIEDAFVAGLATLTPGDVFADEYPNKKAGTVDEKAVVFAEARVSGEGELSDGDIIRIVANVNGEAAKLYVKNDRLSYLSEDEVNAYKAGEEAVDYEGIKLDAVAFTSAEAEEIEEAPLAEVTVVDEIIEEVEEETDEIIEVEAALSSDAISITTQPADLELELKATDYISVEATGTGLTYKWEMKEPGSEEWVDTTISGYKTNRIRLYGTAVHNNRQFRCVITDANGKSVTSNAATVRLLQFAKDGVIYRIITGTDNVMIESYSGTATALTIPSEIEGYTVTEVGESAFENKAIVSISLPNSITVIRKRAFAGCDQLSQMSNHD
ncbi:MAG: leucine-rich repeat protein [Clostridia bacterium]|nr:leucine-rich repeat protein [Clostridia bacterium]